MAHKEYLKFTTGSSGIGIILQPGSTRTLYTSWDFKKALSSKEKKFLDGYEITWTYTYNEQGKKKTNFKATSTTTSKNATWTVPDKADNVKVSIKAKTKSIGSGKKKKKPNWSTPPLTSSTWFTAFLEKDPKLTTPATPVLVASRSMITATVTNYTDTRSTKLQIQVLKAGTSEKVKDATVNIAAGKAVVANIAGVIGVSYVARARAIASKSANNSDWSGYSNEMTISGTGDGGSADPNMPATPATPTTTIENGTFEARVDNYNDTKADRIEIEIVSNDSTSEHTETKEISTGSVSVTYGPVTTSVNYKARARAYSPNDTYITEWTGYSSNVKVNSEAPAAPSVEIEDITGMTLTAVINSYTNENVDYFEFQIVRNNDVGLWNSNKGNTANLINGRASLSITLSDGDIGSEFRARARAHGKTGVYAGKWSDWSAYSSPKKTIPANVDKIETIAAMSSTSIKITWKAAAAADEYKVQYTFDHEGYVIDETFFDTGVDITTIDGIKSLFYPALNLDMGHTYYFRVKAVNATGESAKWSKISSCVIGSTPDPPTTWSYTTVGMIGEDIVFNWVHNTQDSSEQTGARVYVGIKALDGTTKRESSLETQIEGKANSYTFSTSTLSDGDTIYWKVCTRGTKGITNEWGETSTERAITVYTPPELIVGAGTPGEGDVPTVSSFPIDILLQASPVTQTPIAYYVSIIANSQYDVSQDDGVEVHVSEGEVIYQKYIEAPTENPNTYTLTLLPGDLYLVDGVTYTITGTVTMSNGLDAEGSCEVEITWQEVLYSPNADVEVNEDTLTATIRPYCADENGMEVTQGFMLAVYRTDYDGTFTLIQDKIEAGTSTTVLDPHPSLDYARYRVVATDNLTGVVSFDDIDALDVSIPYIVMQWNGKITSLTDIDEEDLENLSDDWFGTVLTLPCNVDVTDDVSPDVAMVEYIGRSHPVSYYGTQEGKTSSWKADISKDDNDTLRKIRNLATYRGDVYVREPYGTGYWANVKVSYSITHNSPVIPVSFSITRVEGGM